MVIGGDEALYRQPRRPADNWHHRLKHTEEHGKSERLSRSDLAQNSAHAYGDRKGIHSEPKGNG